MRKQTGARLGRSQSLKSRAKISELFKKARKRSGSRLTVFYSLCPSESPCRTGESPCGTGQIVDSIAGDSIVGVGVKILIAVPKRTGNAVLRNKIRRRLREEFRLWEKRHELAGELIVRYNPPGRKGAGQKKSAATVKPAKQVYDRAFYAELREDLQRLLEYVHNNTVHINR